MRISPSPPAPSPDLARLGALIEQVFAGGATVRALIIALSAGPFPTIAGPVFRAALDRYGLRSAFDAILQDPQGLEQLESVRIAGISWRGLELRLTRPLQLRQRVGLSTLRINIARELALLVDDRGEVTLRRGDITVTWLKLTEDVLVRLRPVVDRAGAVADRLLVSAGHVISQSYPLEVITLEPAVRLPAAPVVAAPPMVSVATPAPHPPAPTVTPPVRISVVHRAPGRIRLRIAGLYRDNAARERLERALRGRSDVISATANVLTGTLLIVFEQLLDHTAVENLVQRILSSADLGADGARAQARHPWHLFDPEQTALLLDSSPAAGLCAAAAAERLHTYGLNRLPQAVGRSPLSIMLEQFASLPVVLLGASALVAIATGGLLDGVVILGVVALNAGIGYTTEYWAEQTIAGLNRGLQPQARVVRDGREYDLPGADLAPGDLVVLQRGVAVPADARLIDVEQLSVDESALTGESVPVSKTAHTLTEHETPLGSRVNMVYRGTVVTGGSARALVVATGLATEVGEIQRLLGATRQPETPLQRQLRALSGQLVTAALAICGGVFGIGLLRGQPAAAMFRTAIALAVAAVPEGLPTVATTTLALGLRRLERHGILVRRLAAVETLGAVEYLCLDKTGTITRNAMTLVAAFAGGARYTYASGAVRANDAPVDLETAPALREALRLTALCSEVRLEAGPTGTQLVGTPTETALVQAALDLGIAVDALRHRFPLLRVRLRSEGRGFMDTLHANGSQRLLAVKGSPDQVLALCNRLYDQHGIRPLTDADRAQITVANEHMAGQALRVLGVAALPDDGLPEERRDLIWAGLLGIADPPRPEIAELIARLRAAGVKTIMITGDQSATATAIARQIGLSRSGQLETLDAARLETLPADVLRSLAERVDIFSRVSPAHKLAIVQALQRAGHVVAMTGDGINDGPALRAADIGIAMGAGGSTVAQEVADMVVREDNLATIVLAIEQGRTIYSDIKKAVHFILASNTSEIMLTLVATTIGLGEPLTPLQLLWINLVTDVFPELALGLEPPEPGILRQPPRDPQAAMFSRTDVRRIGMEGAALTISALGAYGWGLARYGAGPTASNLAFTTLTAAQLLYAISCRSEQHWFLDPEPAAPNPYMALAISGGLGLQGAATLLPGLRRLLGSAPLAPADWLLSALLAVAPFLTGELIKASARPHPTLAGEARYER
jgi:P-type Ca2+ transporter type 2C